MAIIIDLKNAIRDKIHSLDADINFNFNEIETVDYPYIFFYIPSYRIDKALDPEYWRKLELLCVLEYANSEDNNNNELWGYADTLTQMITNILFNGAYLNGRDPELKIIDDVLQLTFNLELYVKVEELADLMLYLDFSYKN